jgi:hypothetical protein
MAKLIYWVAQCLDDGDYKTIDCDRSSIISKTKRDCQLKVDEARKAKPHSSFLPVKKAVIVYSDAFDLLDQLTREGGFRGYSNSNA